MSEKARTYSYDTEKVDELTLALLYLGTHRRDKQSGARAWKSFDWDAMSRLHEKGFISDPVSKSKSVAIYEEAYERSKELFEKHFAKSE